MCRSLDELIKSRSVHLNRLGYGLVSINIKLQKHYLNMNPACSASLLRNDTDVWFHLLHTRVARYTGTKIVSRY